MPETQGRVGAGVRLVPRDHLADYPPPGGAAPPPKMSSPSNLIPDMPSAPAGKKPEGAGMKTLASSNTHAARNSERRDSIAFKFATVRSTISRSFVLLVDHALPDKWRKEAGRTEGGDGLKTGPLPNFIDYRHHRRAGPLLLHPVIAELAAPDSSDSRQITPDNKKLTPAVRTLQARRHFYSCRCPTFSSNSPVLAR